MQESQSAAATRPAFFLLGLTTLTIAVFARSLRGEFVWDDSWLITDALSNPDYWRRAVTRSFLSDFSGKYRPVVSLAYGVEYRLFGPDPVGFHIVSLILHATCVALVFLWLRRRLGVAGDEGRTNLGAALGALLFACHPSRAESVAWISGSTDLWMTLWVLVALTIWDRTKGVAGGCAAGLFLVAAFFSKELALLCPVALATDHLLRIGSKAGRKRIALRLPPVAALCAGAVLIHVRLVPTRGGSAAALSPSEFLQRCVGALGGYVRIVLWPWPPSTEVGALERVTGGKLAPLPAASFPIGIVVLIALVCLCVAAIRRPVVRPWLADAAWFFVPLALVLPPLSERFYVTERSLYLPALGVASIVARGVRSLLARPSRAHRLAVAGIVAVEALYAVSASAHAADFSSSTALWSREARLHPTDTAVLGQLYQAWLADGRYEEAEAVAAGELRAAPGSWSRPAVFNDWLEADFRQAPSDDRLLEESRRRHDELAAGKRPDGPAGELFDLLSTSEREELKAMLPFQVRRAELALATGDFELSIQQLRALDEQPGRPTTIDVVSPLVVALVAGGQTAAAAERLRQAQSAVDDPGWSSLADMVMGARKIEAQHLAPPEARVQLAVMLQDGGKALPALALMRGADSSHSASMLAKRFLLDVALRRYASARAEATDLSRLDPASGKRLGEQLDEFIAVDHPQ